MINSVYEARDEMLYFFLVIFFLTFDFFVLFILVFYLLFCISVFFFFVFLFGGKGGYSGIWTTLGVLVQERVPLPINNHTPLRTWTMFFVSKNYAILDTVQNL